jgi:hypothetical protein
MKCFRHTTRAWLLRCLLEHTIGHAKALRLGCAMPLTGALRRLQPHLHADVGTRLRTDSPSKRASDTVRSTRSVCMFYSSCPLAGSVDRSISRGWWCSMTSLPSWDHHKEAHDSTSVKTSLNFSTLPNHAAVAHFSVRTFLKRKRL